MCGSFSGKMRCGLIDVKRAVKVLNENNHNDTNTYSFDGFIVSDEHGDYKYTKFEAVAIANAYK